MSIRAMSLVWERSRAKGSNFTMLLAIADHAKDDGRQSWPSLRTLTFKTRLTGRAGEFILAKLVTEGEVEPTWSETDGQLYLHVRCVSEWDRYQQEGPIPSREPERKLTREKFARKLLALYANRPPVISEIPRTVSENADTVCEKSSVPSNKEPKEPFNQEPRETPDALRALWNAVTTPPILRALALTPKRTQQARLRLTDRPLAEWRDVFARIERAPFCRGENDRSWRASFGWVISAPDVAVKVLEGLYDRPTPRSVNLPSYDWTCPHTPGCLSRFRCHQTSQLAEARGR